MQKFEDADAETDTTAKADLEAALDSLATGLVLAEEQRQGDTSTYEHLSLLCADILEPVGALLVHRPDDVPQDALSKFQGGGLETSALDLLLRALKIRVDMLGLEGAVGKSEALLQHLAVLSAQKVVPSTVSAGVSLPACRVFDVLADCSSGSSSSSNQVLQVVESMQSVAAKDSTAASSRVHEWGARAIAALFKAYGKEVAKRSSGASASPAAEAVRVLTGTANAHQRNAALLFEVCSALLPTMESLRGAASGEGQGELVDASNQAVSMLLAALDVHKNELHVRREALQVRQSRTSKNQYHVESQVTHAVAV